MQHSYAHTVVDYPVQKCITARVHVLPVKHAGMSRNPVRFIQNARRGGPQSALSGWGEECKDGLAGSWRTEASQAKSTRMHAQWVARRVRQAESVGHRRHRAGRFASLARKRGN